MMEPTKDADVDGRPHLLAHRDRCDTCGGRGYRASGARCDTCGTAGVVEKEHTR